jgi:hypothetical protein
MVFGLSSKAALNMHTSRQSLSLLLAALALTLLVWDQSASLSTAQKDDAAAPPRPEIGSVAVSRPGLVPASGADEAELERPGNVSCLPPWDVATNCTQDVNGWSDGELIAPPADSADEAEHRQPENVSVLSAGGPVTIQVPEVNRSFCGVLIAPRAVLTVAHGVYGSKDARNVLVCGISAKALAIHPQYKPGEFDNDLAIVVLAADIPGTASSGTFPALHEGTLLRIGTPLRIEYRSGPRQVTLTSIRTNLNLYGGFPALCEHGDSGTPVYSRDKKKIVGLVAGTLGWSRTNVATDILVPIGGHNKSWIASVIRRHTTRTP